ncbi:acetyl-CoA hydrolase/transferase family protein [Nevskia ramosa]|uniref:acetyl-CoA hydrolase/transferase family protein n=1 Tax=Nevskia ramosa TaxID=64002 RepID=UPI0023555CEF|nr:acetyl-CoA hydrolase/transferase C-terminal domain-containing protein [Nevskia ramosa]
MAAVLRCTVEEIVASLRPGMTVFVPGVSGESLAFHAALRAQPEFAAGVRFAGLHFPGINRTDYLGLHAEARQRGYVMTPGLRAGLADGRAELVPVDYPAIYRDLASNVAVDLAIAQVSAPDADGNCSLGPSLDFHPAVWAKARRRVLHINPRLPRTRGSWSIAYATADAAFEADSALVNFDAGGSSETIERHAALVAGLVRDGDTLEFGVGKLPGAILVSLRDHRDLRIWSGMVTPQVAALVDAGAVAGEGAIDAGVALGDAAFYERLGQDRAFHFRPVSETHDMRRIAAIDNFCAINSAVEVDLFGQVNADSLNGKLMAGVGGLPAFVAGAQLSNGGRSIVALPAATDDGRFTRIVGSFDRGMVALPRHCADYVVTEHGVAALRGLSIHERARALIAVAAPAFRESLETRWADIASRL